MSYLVPKIKDNASGQLDAIVNTSSTSVVLQSGDGANFPQPITASATSAGTSTTLNSTGIQAAGVAVGDIIVNLTDSTPATDTWSAAVVKSVSTDSVTTTPLKGGSDNTWQASDSWVVNPFVINLSKRSGGILTGSVTQYEKVLITSRATDTLSMPAVSGYRGFDGTSVQTFAAADFVTIEVDQSFGDGLKEMLSRVFRDFPQSSEAILQSVGTASGDTLYYDGSNWVRLAKGNDDDVLKLASGVPSWGSSGGSAGVVTKEAGENVSAMDRLAIDADGKFYKAGPLGLNGSVGTALSGTFENVAVCQISDNKFAVAAMDLSSSSGKVVVAEWDGSSWSFGTALTFSAVSGGIREHIVWKYDTDKIAVSTRDTGGNCKTTPYSVSGTTLTAGTTATSSSLSTYSNVNYPSRFILLDNDKVLLTSNVSSSSIKALTITCSGTTATHSSTTTLVTHSNIENTYDLVPVDTDYAVMNYRWNTSNYYSVVIDCSGSAPAKVGTESSHGLSTNRLAKHPTDDTKIIAGLGIWDVNTSTGAITDSGNYFSQNITGYYPEDEAYITSNIVAKLTAGDIKVYHYSSVTADFDLIETIDNVIATAETGSALCFGGKPNKIVAVTANNGNVEIGMVRYKAPSAYFFANTAATSGNNVDGVTSGGELTGESGLTIGEAYYKDDEKIGFATSATSVLLNFDL